MEQADLKAAQAPLKERYRAEPEAARVTLRAEGRLGESEVSCRVDTGRALVEAGLHPATGGTGLLACSGDMLLEALVACAGVTLAAVATVLGLEVSGTVHAEGDLDFRGTLGVGKDDGVPVGFSATASCTRRLRAACLSTSLSDAENSSITKTTHDQSRQRRLAGHVPRLSR